MHYASYVRMSGNQLNFHIYQTYYLILRERAHFQWKEHYFLLCPLSQYEPTIKEYVFIWSKFLPIRGVLFRENSHNTHPLCKNGREELEVMLIHLVPQCADTQSLVRDTP